MRCYCRAKRQYASSIPSNSPASPHPRTRYRVVLIGVRIRSGAAYAVVDPDTFRNEFNVAGIGHFVKKDKLEPRWEDFIKDFWRPGAERLLADVKTKNSLALNKSEVETIRASLSLAAFDFSNDQVNAYRAEYFLLKIAPLRTTPNGETIPGRAWWPKDAAGIIEAIKEEQRKAREPWYEKSELEARAARLREAQDRGQVRS